MNTQKPDTTQPCRSLTVAGLFAGIGGIELGLHEAGHTSQLLCEIDGPAQAVLRHNFTDIPLHPDVTTLRSLPRGVDMIAAGFPCQDISLAGTRAGLNGGRSGLIWEVFRLASKHETELLLLENVQHLLRLEKGENLRIVLDALEEMGYRWAYRVVDSRGFGLPQRRLRIIILASRGPVDPCAVLFSRSVQPEIDDAITVQDGHHYGFYWTEGKRGVGWAKDAVPTIKGGSGLGIPSPPAVFDSLRRFAGTPTIEDAERLQGFLPGWTDVSTDGNELRPGARWKLVGNAVSVPVGRWLGEALVKDAVAPDPSLFSPLEERKAWPDSAAGFNGRRYRVTSSTHVEVAAHTPIAEFLNDPLKPLSTRALMGYLSRARAGTKVLPAEFLEALEIQAAEQDSVRLSDSRIGRMRAS
jgi:DNA (cytosine-5)-methyltransferase 1